VNGAVTITGALTANGNTILGDASTDTLNVGNGGLVKDASGNVGIGTSSPTVKLDIAQSSPGSLATFVKLKNNNADANTGATIEFAGFYNAAKISGFTPNAGSFFGGALRFDVYNNSGAYAEAMRIDSSGNLLVGKTTTAATTAGSYFSTNDFAALIVSQATGNRAVVFSNTSGTGTGNITINASTTSYNTSSDYRLKNTIAPMTGALDKVALLKPVTYKWNADGSDGQGFIAHELAEVEAGCVTGEKDAVDADGNPKYQGIDTSFLVATLTAAIQEQQALIQTLTDRITALEGTQSTT
jgi:hypothetical protein